MILVTVSRSGGIAGMTQRWTASIGEDDWDLLRSSAGTDPAARDRFVYRVTHGRQAVVIPDSRLDGRLRRVLSGPTGPGVADVEEAGHGD